MADPVWDLPGHVDVLEQTGATARFSLTGGSARTKHLITYAEAEAFAAAVLGAEEVFDDDVTAAITVTRPKRHPWFTSLYATNVSFDEELGSHRLPSDESLEYERDYVVATVEYETATYNESDDQPRLIVNIRFASEVVAVGESTWQFTSGQKDVKPDGMTIGRCDYEVIIPRAPRIPPALFTLANRINSSPITFLPDGLDGSAGLVKLGAPEATETTTIGNARVYSLRLPFQWREINWNHKFNPFTGTFEEISHSVSGRKKYLTGDLNLVLI